MLKAKAGVRVAMVVAAGTLILAACSGGSSGGGGSSSASGSASGGGGATPQKGGTIYYLTNAEQFDKLDPQIMYTGEDLAFFGATMYRTLTAYKLSPDDKEGTSLVPDMATDTGQVADGGKTWTFTIKDGVTFETGDPVTCADIKYGVSRTFDQEITGGGPTYAIQYLDVPTDADGNPTYKGPYSTDAKNDVASFDKAIECSADGKTITFHLAKPVPDFNYTVTLAAFAPVPKAADKGATYDDHPVSSGPYKISEYNKGKGGKLVLVRNDKWNPASDTYRAALPDTWEVDFGLEESAIDQRLIADSGPDQTAIGVGLTTASLDLVFQNPATENRRIDGFDPYVRYYALNVTKVPDTKVRIAIASALDREALLKNAGGTYAGTYADGVVKPNIGIDYAPTGLWDGLLGQAIPPAGDPEFSKKLLTEAGKSNLTITFDYPQSEDGDKAAGIIVQSLARAGITAKPNPIEPGQYYGIVFDPEKAHEMIAAGWGPDWPNASTVIPPLYTMNGGFDLSQVDDKAFNAKVEAASVELDRNKQATAWQALNKEAAAQMWIIPNRFGKEQRLAGSKVGPIYLWPAHGSWPYAAMGVTG